MALFLCFHDKAVFRHLKQQLLDIVDGLSQRCGNFGGRHRCSVIGEQIQNNLTLITAAYFGGSAKGGPPAGGPVELHRLLDFLNIATPTVEGAAVLIAIEDDS